MKTKQVKILLVNAMLFLSLCVSSQTKIINDPEKGIYNGAAFTSIKDTAIQFIGAHQDGSLMGIKLYKGTAMPHYLLIFDKTKTHSNIIEIDKSGFPLRSMIDSVMFFYTNYTDSTVDIAAAKNQFEYEIFKDVNYKTEIAKIKETAAKIIKVNEIKDYGKGPRSVINNLPDYVSWSDIMELSGYAMSVSSCVEKIPTFAMLGVFSMAQTASACGTALAEILGGTYFAGNENWERGLQILKAVDATINPPGAIDFIHAALGKFVETIEAKTNQRILNDLSGIPYSPEDNKSNGTIDVKNLNDIFEVANYGKSKCAEFENEIKNTQKQLTADNYAQLNKTVEKIKKKQDSIRLVTVERITDLLKDKVMEYPFEKTDNDAIEYSVALFDNKIPKVHPYKINIIELYGVKWGSGKAPEFLFRVKFNHQPMTFSYIDKFGEKRKYSTYLRYIHVKPLSADGKELTSYALSITDKLRVKREVTTSFSLDITEKIKTFNFYKSSFGPVFQK